MNRILECCESMTQVSYITSKRNFYVWFICAINVYCFHFKLKSRMFVLLIENIFSHKGYALIIWESRLRNSIQNILLIITRLYVWVTSVYSHCKYSLSVVHGPINTLLIPLYTRQPSSRLIVFSRVHVQC